MAGTTLKQRREKKLDGLRDLLVDAQLKAAAYIRDIQDDKEEQAVRWADRTVKTQVNAMFVDSTMKAERTKTMIDSGRQLGIIMVPVTIEGNRNWEKYAVEAAKQNAIEATVETSDDGS
jgi:hypothetical protein